MKLVNIIIAFSILISFSIELNGQGGTPSSSNSNQVTLPSPGSVNMVAQNQLEVNGSSGTTTISIPLYTLSDNGINVPISISYNTRGMRVDDVSSCIGMGWSLNAGGSVTRVLHGTPDEFPNDILGGFAYSNEDVLVPFEADTISTWQDAESFMEDFKDGEPDIFHFNVGGYSGSFILTWNNEFFLMPKMDIDISYSLNTTTLLIDEFVIITPNGFKYILNEVENAKTSTNSIEGSIPNPRPAETLGTRIPSTWKISKIENLFNKQEFDFTYNETHLAYDQNYNENYILSEELCYIYAGNPEYNQWSGIQQKKFIVRKVREVVQFLSEISTNNYKVKFIEQSGDRGDIGYALASPGGSNKLDKIEIYSKKGVSETLIKTIEFTQEDIKAQITSNCPSTDTSAIEYRMFLESVQEFGTSGESIPPYRFEYIDRDELPKRLSLAQDFWGYYNGETSNYTFVGDWDNTLPPNDYFDYANRYVNESTCQNGTLNKIYYPTGLIKTLEYESNEIPICDSVPEYSYQGYNVHKKFIFDSIPPGIDSLDFEIDANDSYVNVYAFLVGGFCQATLCKVINGEEDSNNPILLFDNQNGTEDTIHYYETVALDTGTYRIKAITYLSGIDEEAYMTCWVPTATNKFVESRKVGGLRIKRISDSEGFEKSMIYSGDVNDSICSSMSGFITRNPAEQIKYLTKATNVWVDYYYTFKRYDQLSLSTMNWDLGNDLGYKEVWEVYGDQGAFGYNYKRFLHSEDQMGTVYEVPNDATDCNPLSPSVRPNNMGWRKGYLLESKSYNSDKQLVRHLENSYLGDEYGDYDIIHGMVVKENYRNKNGQPNTLGWYEGFAVEIFPYYSSWIRKDSSINTIYNPSGGEPVKTITAYEYDTSNYNLIKELVSDIGGKTQTTDYIYKDNVSGSGYTVSVPTEMNTNKMSGVLLIKAGSGQIKSGSKTEYSSSFSGCQGCILPSSMFSLKKDDSWKEITKYTKYNSSGNPVKIKQNTMKDTIVLTWVDDLITKRQYGGRTWDYIYNDARQVSSYTDHTGVQNTYKYDGLQRLESSLSRNNTISNVYSYYYAVNGGENKVVNELNYPGDPTIGKLKFETVYNPKGATTANRKLKYTMSGGDFNVISIYDPMGRTIAECDPSVGQGCSQIEVEKSPENRILSIVLAGSPVSISKDYGTNSQTIDGYISGSLFRETTTDENGVKFEVYTDIFGRKIQEIVDKGGFNYKTDYSYNSMGLISSIAPPKGVYSFTYYDDGLLKGKTIPDKDSPYQYSYTSEDQLLSETLPNGSSLGYKYNDPYNELIDTINLNGSVIKSYTYQAVKGYLTGEVISTLNAGGFVNNTYVPDDFGRPESSTSSYLNGNSTTSFEYDAADNVLNESTTFNIGGEDIDVVKDYKFDKGVRLIETRGDFHEVGAIKINEIGYNNNDWMIGKDVGRMGKMSYGYNARGWIKKINGIPATFPPEFIPCDEDSTGVNCEGPFTVTDISILFNCVDLAIGQLTEIDVNIITITTTDNGTTTDTVTLSMPMNGGTQGIVQEFENEISATIQAGMNPGNTIDGLIQQIKDCLKNNGDPNTDQNTETQNEFNLNGLSEMIMQELNFQTGGASVTGSEPGGPGGASPAASVLFGMELFYFEGNGDLEAPSQFNGNISWMKWRTAGEKYTHKYGFDYDAANRLTKATYKAKDLEECVELPPNAFQVLIHQYDEIGNIDSLSRSGYTGLDSLGNPTYGLVDQLGFEYKENTVSTLKKVTETADVTRGFGNSSEYGFDSSSGNLMSDQAKGILSIDYNYLNLPQRINFRGGSLNITYDANGRKLRQWLEDRMGNVLNDRYYSGGVEHLDGELEAIYHEEGRIVYDGSLPIINGTLDIYKEFYLKDHLGNVRVRFVDKNSDQSIQVVPDNFKHNEITASYNYYPFGMQWDIDFMMDQPLENRYQYNSKEYVEDFGLKWNDYGARWYDAAVGRFTTIDPLADKIPAWSQYSYSFNNPIRFIDPDGMAPDDIIIGGANNSSITIETDLIDVSVNASGIVGDLGGNYTLQGDAVLEASLDIVGIVDPTGVADMASATMQAQKGEWGGAIMSGLGVIPYVGDLAKVGKVGKHTKTIKNAVDLAKKGRTGKQARLKELATDPKVSSADRGWIKNEMRHIKTGNRKTIRNPRNSRNSKKRGTELAHPRGKRAKDGHSYKNAKLQDADLHKLEHKHGGYK